MSLYRHVADRDDLVARTVDQALAEVELPEHPAHADQIPNWLLSMAAVTRETLRRYPGTADHLLLYGPTGPYGVAFMDRVFHVLADAGRSPADVAFAYDWLMTTIAAYIAKQDRLDQAGGTPEAATDFQRRTAEYGQKLRYVRQVSSEFTGEMTQAFDRTVAAVVAAIFDNDPDLR